MVDGLGGKANGTPREDGFDITVASEVMAVLCLSKDIPDLKERLGRIVVGYTYGGAPVTAGDLKATGAMAALLKDALKPNLVQTLEGTPSFVHGGPFANIAHGCNSVMATRMALALGDIVVTEAGFGADLGAEKFLDIKCRMAGLSPDAVVVVATARALKMNGGVAKADLNEENLEALEKGLPNLLQHVRNMEEVFGMPVVVAINRHPTDTEAELALIAEKCAGLGVNAVLSEVWAKGGEGGIALAEEVLRLVEQPSELTFSYPTGTDIAEAIEAVATKVVWAKGGEGGIALAEEVLRLVEQPSELTFSYPTGTDIAEAIEAVATKVYHADGVDFTPQAQKQIETLRANGFGNLPVCIAKTQYSFSDDAAKLGAPRDFRITVREVKVSAGAGFVVALTGAVMTMPGLPKVPAAEKIDVDESGKITGLF